MKVPVWVGYCEHGFLQAAMVAEYSTPNDVKRMKSEFRVEMQDGPITIGGVCELCEPKTEGV